MIRIIDLQCKATLKAAAAVSVLLLFAAVAAFGQQQVNLTAAPTTTTLPDGTTVPMWSYFCGTAVSGGSLATCASLNPLTHGIPALWAPSTTYSVGTAVVDSNGNVQVVSTPGISSLTAPTWNTSGTTNDGATLVWTFVNSLASYLATSGSWSPVLITVPTGAAGGLQINLTNNLSFTPTGSTTANTVPTSIVIVGQVGGGLGTPTTMPGPDHSLAQGCPSWFIAANPPGTPCTALNPSASGQPPMQGPRVQSMGMEVAAGTGTPTSLTWANLKPGTYLLESGTHPSIQVPMGLIGVLVVTCAPGATTCGTVPAGTAYPAVTATTTTAGVPAVSYNAEVPLEFSEIDPVQNKAVSAAVNTANFSETKVWDGHTGACGDPSSSVYHTCYPPAVNYTPFYFLINGVAFSKASPAASQFTATSGTAATPGSGTILVRMVNAGLRMHVPSIVGSTTTGFNGAGALSTTPVGGFTVIAEDGTPVPNQGAPRVQTDIFMAAGKVFDVMVNVPATATTSFPVFARDLGLSANSSVRDAGMLAYIGVTGAALPVAAGSGIFAVAQANPDTYNSLVAGQPFTVSDPSKGVLANDVNVYGSTLLTPPAHGTITCGAVPQSTPTPGMCANGTFTYTPNSGSTTTPDSFTYCANNGYVATTTPASCSPATLMATVTLGASGLTGNPTAIAQTFTAKTASYFKISSPGLLEGNSDPSGLPLTLVTSGTNAPAVTVGTGTLVAVDSKGGFVLTTTTGGAPVTFSYTVQNSQGRTATGSATVNFPTPSNLVVNVVDAQAYANCNGNSSCIAKLPPFPDYKWIIEEDKTFWVDPNCTTTSTSTPGCASPVATGSTIPTFGVNFHTSHMDYVAQGCTGKLSCEGGQTMLDTTVGSPTFGTHIPAVCDLGSGACRPDSTGNGFTPVNPSQVHLDPSKRYYISVLPGDAANPFPANTSAQACPSTGAENLNATDPSCGHGMSGAPIPPACNVHVTGCNSASTTPFSPVNVLVLPTPFPTGKLSVIVFEDDFPLNGEQDGGGGNGTVAPIEPGLGGFELILWDTYGGLGDVTGQDTHDEFNQPLSNSLAGTIDPVTNLDACPISAVVTTNVLSGDGSQAGITGRIVTCPKFESDNHTLSPLAGQAVIANLMPDKFSVQAYPGADRIARGEQWVQTNTLDGQHPHDSFIRIAEPSYFQEYGPAGYHVAIGFANPAIINARAKDVCAGFGTPGAVGPCTNTITGQVNVQRLSRTPDQRLYPSGSRDALAWTQCWVSLGDPDGEDFMFTFCDADGNFKFANVPGGAWRITMGDQWNDQIIDGLSLPVNIGCISSAPNTTISPSTCPGGQSLNMGHLSSQQWQANVYTRTFVDDNKNGIWDPDEIGIPQVYARVYYRDGHTANSLLTDNDGVANFNETFPLFNWYVVEADTTRYKTTGIHTVYDAGGPADGSPSCTSTTRGCGSATSGYAFLANTKESIPLPADLSVPGAVYCPTADCGGTAATSFAAGTPVKSSSSASTGRIDPPWVATEGWSGMTSQGNWIEFGKAPYAVGENGGIYGRVAYASTRPFDDASQMIQQPWQPAIPNVTLNLYQEGFAADGVTPTLTLVDTTQTSSWDDWAQGFYPNSAVSSAGGGGLLPYMNCPGQGTATGTNADNFFFTLSNQPNYLDYYNGLHSTPQVLPHSLPYSSQYKCYDSMHIWNQVQPAPYDGRYQFPSVLGINPATTGGTGWLNTSLTGGVGVPVWYAPTPYAAGTIVMYQGTAYLAAQANTGVVPGSVAAASIWTLTTTPVSWVAAKMGGTNCTVCIQNPDTTDHFRVGTPMLPSGKYVVEVIMPPGYEIEKEEDKNLLIGDNFIAPATVEFAGLGGDIFIIPDQASVASMYDESGAGYNPSNYQNATTNEGYAPTLSLPGFPGFVDPAWPCVGEMRVVPDYLSIYPQVHETAPFAGATRPLCDRKEVTLANQMGAIAKFYLFTSTHIAAKYTGVITDDLTSEFDPFSPQFGEKFAPPNLPISTRDYLGNELSRVYSDHWGTYNGLTYSSWEVNPPNITGYSPAMMTQCMNDPGPIIDTRPGSATLGQLINDPLYNSNYSDFCYEEPYMPGLTNYADTPVVPTAAFVGAAYNSPDCGYPDTTPAIKEVDGTGIGPWVSAVGGTLTITALGDQQVNNSAYAGPSATVAPFNLKTVTRHYGFGTQCTSPAASSATCNTLSQVTVGGVPLANVSWSDTTITGTVQASAVVNGTTVTLPNCVKQQQPQYGGSTAQCGELVIIAGNGKQSIDTVTVTIGGKMPSHVNANGSIQAAIDGAAPGDLIIVDPTCNTVATTTTPSATAICSSSAIHATTPTQTAALAAHNEMLIMWKPVRLQGVGAASSIIDANAFPAGKLLDPWRRHINCLFGLTLNGVPAVGTGGASPAYDPSSQYSCPDTSIPGDTWNYYTASNTTGPQIDRLPLEAVVGWDATVNGNLAEQLQEPSLMGAYEGAGITVLAKGVWTSPGENIWTDTAEGGAFPPDALLLQDVPANPDDEGAPLGPQYSYCFTTTSTGSSTTELVPNPYPSNFECNPSSIDGLSVRDSSQGGGGIFVHGWAHYLQVANDRVYNNAGTLSGGINIGQGEFPVALTVVDQEGTTGAAAPIGEFVLDNPPSCLWIPVIGAHLPYCLDVHVNVHNNMIANNSSLGDELFSGTLAGGGGATFCTGSDYYMFQYNWVCGNLSSAEGGGVAHLGFIYNGDIEHNTIVLNQSTNPTIPTNGGGIIVMGTPDTDPTCGTQIDQDCPPGLSDGTGPGLVINANLIQANMAESGSGGGIRLQQVNGSDVSTFPNRCVLPNAGALVNCPASGGIPASTYWNSASITNNIIVNNLAGWDGAGISLQDSLNVTIQNNTISSNDALASSGVLTQSIGTPESSAPAGSCVQGSGTTSCPQSAGVTSTPNSSLLTTTFTGLTITCPTGATNCAGFSNPILQNNVIWQNRSFLIGVGALGTGNLNQQNLVSLFNAFTGTAAPTQTASGQCSAGVSYWDIGVRGDTGPSNHSSGFTLSPTYSLLDDPQDYAGTTASPSHNLGVNPSIVSQYCNGSRVPPECSVSDGCAGPYGYGVPPGIVDASTPNPVFSLNPSATVDEGNNWINVSWGPLELSNDAVPATIGGSNYGDGNLFANYALNAGSAAIDYIPVAQAHPTTDFFGNPRPDPTVPSRFDIGAIEFQGTGTAAASVFVSPIELLFAGTVTGTTSAAQTLTLTNGTGATFTIPTIGVTAPFSRGAGGATNCGGTLAAGASCTINIVFTPTLVTSYTGTVTIAGVVGSPVALLGSGVMPIRAAAVNPPGLGFFNQPTTDTSFAQTLTVTNTGNVNLAGGTFIFGGGAPQPFARPLLNPGTCGATLAVGASCTINVTFDPATAATFNRTLTVAYSLGTVVTPTPVTLTGNGVAHAAGTLSFTGATGGTLVTGLGGVRTLIFTAGASTAVVNVTNTGTAPLDISATSFPLNLAGRFSLAGTTCSFSTPLAPGTSCTFSIAVTGTTLDVGTFSVTNNGTPTANGDSTLALAVL
jgi:hypothetical protein